MESAPKAFPPSMPPKNKKNIISEKSSQILAGYAATAITTAVSDLMVPRQMIEYVVLADEALVDACNKAKHLILTC